MLAIPKGLPVLGSILGMLLVMAWRVRETQGAVSLKKIVIPPMGMATGMSMFIVPAFRIPFLWAVGALLTGAVVFAYPLVRTCRLERQGDAIMIKRSNAFFLVIIVVAAIRFAARGYLESVLSLQQTGAIVYLLAFGMIVRWRTQMFLDFRALTQGTPAEVC